MERTYIAIDLKSFYASVECVERGLDPLTTNLVVADPSRTAKTICLAVSPSLKAYGIPGRARLFEVIQKTQNRDIEYIVAPPRMALYMEYSTRIYDIYLRYVAPEDMHVYSVDEVFLDVTDYLNTYKMTPHQLAITMIRAVLEETGITATAGIGTNMYLCKIAMDIMAKKMPADKDGVRIAELDEISYRKNLWNHVPLTDFWRVGPGISKKLNKYGIYTMGDIARCSLGTKEDALNEDLLYKLFGVNAELLIDHAWGWEPTTIAEIHSYKPERNSISSGQVLHCPYDNEKARLIVKEMTDLLVLDLVDKGLLTDQMVLTIGYDIDNLTIPEIRDAYKGEIVTDHYGRLVPKHAHGTANLLEQTSSTRMIMAAVLELYDKITNPALLIRRITVTAAKVIPVSEKKTNDEFVQLDLFTDYEALEKQRLEKEAADNKEHNIQKAILNIQKKYGKNALLKGINLEEGGTTISRNGQIGGHKA